MIGHSAGTAAAMRLLENQKLKGVILVAGKYLDIFSYSQAWYLPGDQSQEPWDGAGSPVFIIQYLLGYCDSPWDWEKIK